MYEVLLDGDTLYYPSNRDYMIFDTDLGQDIGLAGDFKFSVPYNNPLYDRIGQGSIITILRDNNEYWRGEVKEVQVNFDNTKSVYCLEDLSWLADEFPLPVSITNETYWQRFQAMINLYNNGRPADRQFQAGYVTNVTISATCRWNTQYDWSILDCLRNLICRDTGYIRVRRVRSGNSVTRYIDIVKLSDYGVQAEQPITFGVNLLDYMKKMDMGNFTNAITPYGAETEDEVFPDYHTRIVGDPIQDATSIARYGRHAKAVIFEGVTDLTQLNGLARAYLTRYSQPQITMEIKALDLAEFSNDAHYEIGDSIHIVAEPYNIDQWIYLTKRNIDLQDAGKNEVTLSGHVSHGSTLTQQSVNTAELVNDLPTPTSILESAKKNALSMLLDETQGGHVIFEYHETDGKADYIEAINICDQPTIGASKKRWRWSANGLGYMWRDSAGTGTHPETTPAWKGPSVAMTSDGNINADRILTGTLNADKVKVNGKIEATSGFIGQNTTNGWNIGNTSIHNGVTAFTDGSHEGIYIGTDGIRINGKPTAQSPIAWVRFLRGSIDASCSIATTGALTGGSVTTKSLSVRNSSGTEKASINGSNGNISTQGSVSAQGNVSTQGSMSAKDGISARGEITTTTGQISTGSGSIFTAEGDIHTSRGNLYTLNGDIVANNGSIGASDHYEAQGYAGRDATLSLKNSDGTTRTLKFRGGILTAY